MASRSYINRDVWHFVVYFKDICVIALCICYWVNVHDMRLINSLTVISLGFELLNYLRGFYNFGHYVKLITEVFSDIWRFLIIAAIMLYTFAVAFDTMMVNEKSAEFKGIWASLM
jgi:hypothetical protein